MARATCRCGQPLEMPLGGADHVVCPRCEARVRIIRKGRNADPATLTPMGDGDGFIRFSCPCGRRLKVGASRPPTHGKCPDCATIVPVPTSPSRGRPASPIETPTQEMSAADHAMLDDWAKGHASRGNGPKSTAEMPQNSPARRAEAGLRVCPKCGKPVHLGAEGCRACGIAVPKRS
ncbi:hypothetical protein P12x_005808 [Tundrisphaera lichenicola]|uniref:hypothetical protein n=1 Tax=Tundrisphaera lichenicola TaxID=2029860 RepID=UPI003EBF1EBF